jgi:hypothetical protein
MTLDILPTDRVVEIARYKRAVIFGVGRYRAEVLPWRSRWRWRAWDVIQPSLGGKGTLAQGLAPTKMRAIGDSTDVLRRETGIEQVAMGGGGPVEGDVS